MRNFCERYFQMSLHGTRIGTEVLGGATTFVTMAYIIVVNPAILKFAGIDPIPGTVATILAAVFGCLLMGFYANRPIAVAPYMGENVFIAFGMGALLTDVGPTEAMRLRLGTVFVSGILFLLLTLLRLRTWLASAISPNLKHSFAVGIGLFLMLIGMVNTGIVIPRQDVINDPVPLHLGPWHTSPSTQLALAGFVLMVLLFYWNVKGAILLGIVITALAGYALGLAQPPQKFLAWPWETEYHLETIALQLDILGVLRLSFLPVLLTLFLVSFLDTLGTLLALGVASPPNKPEGKNEIGPGKIVSDLEKPMLVDSLACIFSALVGTSTSGAYIESATGIRAGARTGLAAVVTGLLFALALLFLPLIQPLQALTFAYGPALMMVGLLMFGAVKNLDVDDLTELVPALATIVMMVFTYNIANGMTAGLILHPFLKLATGRRSAIHPGSAILGILCLLYYLLGIPH